MTAAELTDKLRLNQLRNRHVYMCLNLYFTSIYLIFFSGLFKLLVLPRVTDSMKDLIGFQLNWLKNNSKIFFKM